MTQEEIKIMAKRKKEEERKLVKEFVIRKKSSKAFVVKKGQVLRVIAHEGRQVADIRFLNAHDYREQFTAAISEAWNSNLKIGGIHRLTHLYSKWPWGNIMLTVIDDKIGDHRFGLQCTEMFCKIFNKPAGSPNCADLFDKCFKPYHLSMRDLESDGVFNVFMPVRIMRGKDGRIGFALPSCKMGDYIDFRAEMDVLVAATSCPDESVINDYQAKGMKYQIFE